MSSDESRNTREEEQSNEQKNEERCGENKEHSNDCTHENSNDCSDKDSVEENGECSDSESEEGIDDDSDENDSEPKDERTSNHADELVSPAPCNNRARWLRSIKTFIEETHARTLDLANKKIKRSEALSIFKSLVNSQITEIDMSGNNLKNLMKKISKLLAKRKLKKLNFQDCKLTTEDFMWLMKMVKDANVTDLDISDNNIRFDVNMVTKLVSQTYVTHLNFRGNLITIEGKAAMAQNLSNSSVTHLNLDGVMSGSSITSLFLNLQHTTITDLNLSSNSLSFAHFQQLSKVLKDSKLEKLDLSFNRIRDAEMNVLTGGLVHSKLIDLNLSWNGIKGHNNLGHFLKYTSIKTLNLSYNDIIHDEMFNFPDFLKGSSVSTLILRSCQLSDKIGQELMKSVKSTELTKLDVGSNCFGVFTFSEFSKSVKFTNMTDISFGNNELPLTVFSNFVNCLAESKLKYLDLSETFRFLSINGMAHFLEKTKGSPVVSLDLSDLYFQFDKAIAKSLENTHFTHINLSHCEFRPTDISSLGAALKGTAITHLNLSRNSIEDGSLKILAECLRGTQVVSLDISETCTTSNGVKALADTLKDTNLIYLILYGNRIEDDGLYYLAEQISSTFITVLDLGYNYGSKGPLIAIDTALWENRKIVKQLMDPFKQIVPEVNENYFQFDRAVNSSDVSSLLEDCLLLSKIVNERPSSVNVLAQEKSFSLSKSQIMTLMIDEFPRQFSMFIGRSVEADVTQHVNFLKRSEELGLNKLTELLLLNRPLYVIDEDEDILHPYIYKLMHQYKQPIVNSSIEPDGEEKIINYLMNHEELEGASDILDLLRQNTNNSLPKDQNI